jgi:hypothetical protein
MACYTENQARSPSADSSFDSWSKTSYERKKHGGSGGDSNGEFFDPFGNVIDYRRAGRGHRGQPRLLRQHAAQKRSAVPGTLDAAEPTGHQVCPGRSGFD